MLRVAHPRGYGPERRYAAGVVLGEFLGLPFELAEHGGESVEITLAGDSERKLVIRDVLFRTPEAEWLRPQSVPSVPLRTWAPGEDGVDARAVSPTVPVLFGAPPYLVGEADGLTFGLDVFGSVFFLLTRYEEVALEERDERDRFPAKASLALRAGFLDRPLANEYAELLWSALRRLWPRLERRPRSFRELPSHDVDLPRCAQPTLRATVVQAVRDVLLRREPRLALARVGSYAGRDAFDSFDLLMELSETRGLRSAFYFIAGRTGPIDGDYSIEEPTIRALLRRIDERGHEIGVHTSYGTFRDPARTRAEFERLRRVCDEEGVSQPLRGGRQHFLRWENPTTWQNWEDAGIEYDSSLTFPERAGFRCGACYEYPAFNLRTRTQLGLRERPLVAMDASLMRYERLSRSETVERVAELRRRCRLFDGDFTLLWHNDWLYSHARKRLYGRVLGPG